jgi:hypothetical protein
MKNFDSRAYSINDFLEWSNSGQLELNPKFQRRPVWNENAKSFLMDTILRGKPIPKVFIRQKLNVQTRKSVREVVDGQQRLRTILSYLKDGFTISKKHHTQFGGLYFSQLDQSDPDIQGFILNYEISTDLLINMADSEILDIFSRLNSYSVTLNDQEKLNASHFGPFKTLADSIGHEFHDFWITNKILSDSEVLRMGDVTLTADLLIAMTEGIKSKKQIKPFYTQFEKDFPYDPEVLAARFQQVISTIQGIFGTDFKLTELRRIHVFYSLFTALYHILFGLEGMVPVDFVLNEVDYPKVSTKLSQIDNIFSGDDEQELSASEEQFLEDSRRATTDTTVRTRRTAFIVKLITQ